MIVLRNELEQSAKLARRLTPVVEWLVNLHDDMLLGRTGRHLNGIGAICLTVICATGAVVWWPGITHWRRSLTVNLKSSLARVNWDLHNALGFGCLVFLMMWGISGAYFSYPNIFNAVFGFSGNFGATRQLSFGDTALHWLSNLHFGRFSRFSEAIWAVLGLVPAVLSLTGVFMCCHRLLRKDVRYTNKTSGETSSIRLETGLLHNCRAMSRQDAPVERSDRILTASTRRPSTAQPGSRGGCRFLNRVYKTAYIL
jgi:uncharacterized iron-regulated membrane protein